MRQRVLIAGFGDTGMLVAIHLGESFDITGITTKPCLVSGQELGARLTRPEQWKKDYLMDFSRYKKLDGVRVVQGLIQSIDTSTQQLTVAVGDGSLESLPYDVLVIASGVQNGFWRQNRLQDMATVEQDIEQHSNQLLAAGSINIVGGGATGVSVSMNLKAQHPNKQVKFFFSQPLPLPGYHPKIRHKLQRALQLRGVELHPGHRAIIPQGFDCEQFTTAPIQWSTGQADSTADLTLWTVGSIKPNNQFIPADMLNEHGYVKTDKQLRVAGYDNVFCVGDIAASDPHRSSARNWGYRLVAQNIRSYCNGKIPTGEYRAPEYRWGSIYGVEDDGLRVFQPDGGSFRFPRWSIYSLLFPLAVRRMIYRGVRSKA